VFLEGCVGSALNLERQTQRQERSHRLANGQKRSKLHVNIFCVCVRGARGYLRPAGQDGSQDLAVSPVFSCSGRYLFSHPVVQPLLIGFLQ
jgi:hypothetical protein